MYIIVVIFSLFQPPTHRRHRLVTEFVPFGNLPPWAVQYFSPVMSSCWRNGSISEFKSANNLQQKPNSFKIKYFWPQPRKKRALKCLNAILLMELNWLVCLRYAILYMMSESAAALVDFLTYIADISRELKFSQASKNLQSNYLKWTISSSYLIGIFQLILPYI